MARPRGITDERLLEAVEVVIGQRGPGFTLQQVAAQAGVSVGTVAQRFESKAGLLRALSANTTERVAAEMVAVASRHADPIEGLRAALVAIFAWLGDAQSAANHLGQLGADIGDPELRRLLGEHFAEVERTLHTLATVAAPELPAAPAPERMARVLLALVNGVSLDWSIRPDGPLIARLEQDIDALLLGWKRTEGK